MRAFVALSLLTLLVAGCVTPAGDLAAQDAGGRLPDLLPTVERSLAVDLERWSGEPSILALADGTLLVTGAGGLTRYAEDPLDAPGNAGQSYLWRSTDGGATWSFVDLALPGPLGDLLPYRNAVLGVEGDLAEDENGRAYFVDLTALAANGLSRSDDSGATWTAQQTPVVGQPGTDRPWVAAYGDGIVYVKYLAESGGHRVARSTDAGATFPEDVAIPPCGQGALVADVPAREVLVPCEGDGKLWFLRTPEGAMAWERIEGPVAEGPARNVFVSMAVGATGEYVFAWSETLDDHARLRIAASDDRGETWTEPITLSAEGATGVFPWTDANQEGIVGVVWYEAASGGLPDEVEGEWYPMHASLRLDGASGTMGAPAIVRLSETPIHEGAICTSGLGCVVAGRGEDRRLLDFFEVDVDAAGKSHVAWTSTTTDVPTVWYGQVSLSA